jgi:hypothetical protein
MVFSRRSPSNQVLVPEVLVLGLVPDLVPDLVLDLVALVGLDLVPVLVPDLVLPPIQTFPSMLVVLNRILLA